MPAVRSVHRRLFLAAFAVAFPTASWAAIEPREWLGDWFREQVIDRIEVTGRRTYGFHSHVVEGDREAFNSLNYSGQGGQRFTEIGNIRLSGRRVLDVVNFEVFISDNRFRDPQAQQFSIDYARGPLEVNLGDIRGRLTNTNRFVPFAKSLRGAMAGYRHGGLEVRALYSEAKGSPRTLSIQGANSAGPYYLQTSQIVAGSESVLLDGVPQRLGIDYTISYEVGSITFVGKIVPPTSTIVVTFEAFGFNAPRGTVQGIGATYDFGAAGRIGLTMVEQKSRGAGTLSTRTELFQGFGAPSTPYYLEFEPLQGAPILVRVDGILQIEGVDYFFDAVNPAVFFFTRFVPSTSTIQVVYTPRPTATVDGDREVIGIDYRLPVRLAGATGALSVAAANGRLKSGVNPSSGIARGADLNLSRGPLTFRASARDIPDGFVSVESRTFNRNERAHELGLDYRPTGGIQWDTSHRNASIAVRQVSPQGEVIIERARYTEARAGASFGTDSGPTWRLEHVRTASNLRGDDTRIATTELSTSRQFGRLQATFGFSHQDGRGPLRDAEGATRIGTVALDTLRFSGAYRFHDDLILSARAGVSMVKTDERSGRGNDINLSLAYSPGTRLSTTAAYAISRSGQIATLGMFQSGSGFGYGGNGFAGGVDGTTFNAGPADLVLWTVNTQYRVSDRFGLNVFAQSVRQTGSVTSNTDSNTLGVALDYDLGSNHAIFVSWDNSRTRFVGSDLAADSQNLGIGIVGSPPGRLSYRVGLNQLISGRASQFGQDSTQADLSATYRLDDRQRLIFTANAGQTRRYLPQDEKGLALGYQRQIYRTIALTGWYRFRDVRNLDPTVVSGAYRSRGLDLELTFNFR